MNPWWLLALVPIGLNLMASRAVLRDMETAGIRVDEAELRRTGEEFAGRLVAMEAEIQALLVQYSDELDELGTTLNDPLLPPNNTQKHAIQRHRELLLDFEREFFRSKTHVRQVLDRHQLLGHVKQDIHDYRTQHASEVQSYLDERSHLERSHLMMDETLDQAYATQQEFRGQREQLGHTLTRLTRIAAQMPGVQSIISLISRRRRRDTIVLAVVIGVCLVILLLVGVRR